MIGMETATPAELARTEDPGLSIAREAAEVVPAESVRRNGNQHLYLSTICNRTSKMVSCFFGQRNVISVFDVFPCIICYDMNRNEKERPT